MKKTLILFAITLFVLQAPAQDKDLLNRIRTAGNSVQTIEADLTNVRLKAGATTSQNGTLHFVAPKEMAAVFTTGQHMIANEKKLKVDIGVFHGSYRLREGGIPRSLSNIFLYAFQGRCQDLADENDYSIKTSSSTQYHDVTFTSKKKHILGIGYKKVVFRFSTKDLRVKEIALTDYKDTVDTYTISNVKYNIKIGPKLFSF
ncbi:MAG: outer-membrane lipoprotein carrier protein LolA [Bacteroidales bacterium]|nr:outer-membrane lipoprotein carrier protein LolA [Bacteroidales bacterium]